ncbi:MAG: branched chain amino acid aminotransferase, partial [Crocinitomicaceae bacterium]
MSMLNETLSLKITKSDNSRINSVDWDNLPFGKVFSDHILVMEYKGGTWHQPEIKPFESFNLHPATSALHYGQSIFEGMKANKTSQG